MNGRWRWQKLGIAVLYLAVCCFLCYRGLLVGADPTSLGVMCGGIAGGVTAFMWGNVQEHKAKNGG